MNKKLPLILLIIFCLIYLRHFHPFELFRSHDLEIHGVRLANYYLAFSQGQFPPRFAPNLNFGFGYPVFIVSYALPHLIGLVLYILTNSIELSINLTIIAAIFFALMGMYQLGRHRGGDWLGLLSACLYLSIPYFMATLFIRGALAEITFLGLLPWIFVGIDRFFRSPLTLSLSIIFELVLAAFLISHPPSLVASLPIIGLYVLIKLHTTKKRFSSLLPLLMICCTAVLVTMFFWLPFLAEKQYVMAGQGFSTSDYAQKFPPTESLIWSPWTYGGLAGQSTADFSHRIGLVYLLILFIILLKPFLHRSTPVRFWLWVSAIGIFMLTPWSDPVWHFLVPLQSVQFPWRLLWLPALAAIMALLSLKITQFNKLKPLLIILGLVAFHHAIFYAHPAGYIQNSDQAWLNNPHSGSSDGEYDPIWFNNHQNLRLTDRLVARQKDQPLFSKDDQTGRVQIGTQIQTWTGSAMTYQIDTPQDIDLLQSTLYFPGWQVVVDGMDTLISYQDPEFSGRIIFPLTAGRHDVTVTFTNDTWDRRLGDSLTLIGLGIITLQIGCLGWQKLRPA